jgi:hypothetical protein
VKTHPNIITALAECIPELEPAQEQRDGHMTDSEEPDEGMMASPEQQEPTERRFLLQRFFFGP